MADVVEIRITGKDVSGKSTLASFRTELNKTETAAGGMGKSMGALGGILGGAFKIGVAGAAAGIVALTGVVAGGVSKAMTLQQTVADTAAVMGKSAEEVAPLKELIEDLGIDPTLKVNAEEAGQAINMLARNGLDLDEIMEGAAKSTVLLANATGSDFGTAADIATDVMSLFNIEAKDMNRAVDGITSVVNNSKFSVEDYALALAQGGGVASAVGVGFEDFNTTIAAISPLFASGSDAGTSLKTMLQRLVPSTNAAADEMKRLGLAGINMELLAAEAKKAGVAIDGMTQTDALNTLRDSLGLTQAQFGDFKVQTGILQTGFHNIDGSMKSMDEVATALSGALGGLSDKQKVSALNTIFGTDAMRAASAMAVAGGLSFSDLDYASGELGTTVEDLTGFVDTNTSAFSALQEKMGETSAIESAETRMGTLSGKLDILQGIIDAVWMKIGDAFIPVIETLVGVFTSLAETHGPAVIDFFQKVADKVGILADNLPLAKTALEELKNKLSPFNDEASGSLSGLTELGVKLGISRDNMDSLAVALYNGKLAFLAAKGAIETLFTPLSDAIADFVEWKDVLTAVGIIVGTKLVLAIGGFLVAMAPALLLFGAVTLGVAALRTAWETNFLGIQTAVDTLMTGIETFGGGALAEIGAFLGGTETDFANLKALFGSASEAVGIVFDNIVGYVVEKYPIWKEKMIEWGNVAWGWIVTAKGIVLKKLGEWWGGIQAYVIEKYPIWKAKLLEWGGVAWGWIVTAKGIALKKIGEWWGGIQAYVIEKYPIWKEKMVEWGGVAWGWIVTAKGIVLKKLGEWWGGIQAYVIEKYPIWKEKMVEWGGAAWDWLVTAKTTAMTKLGEWGTALFNYMVTNLPTWAEKTLDWGTELVTWIGEALPLSVEALGDWVVGMIDWVNSPEGRDSLSDSFSSWGGTLSNWMDDEEDSLPDKAEKFVEALGTAFVDILEQIIETGVEIGVAIIDGIWTGAKDGLPTLIENISSGEGSLTEGLTKFFNSDAWKVVGILSGATLAAAIGKRVGEKVSDHFPDMTADGESLVEKFALGFSASSMSSVAFNAMGGLSQEFDRLTGLFHTHVGIKAAELLDKFKEQFSWQGMKDTAKDAIKGLLDGFDEDWQSAVDTVSGLGDSMLTALKSVWDSNSPSKAFMEEGENAVDGILLPFDSMLNQAVSTVGGFGDSLLGGFSGGVAPSAGESVSTDNSSSTTNVFQITLQVAGETVEQVQQTIDELAFRYNANLVGAE